MLAVKTILHPTDFSADSLFAYRLACAIARDYGARLIVLHVMTPPTIVYGGGPLPPEPWPTVGEMKAKLQQLTTQARAVSVEPLLVEGYPVDMILRVAKESHTDVIVMGTHGRSMVAQLLMGSVADGVLRKASCPVLTVKTPAPREGTVEKKVEQPAAV
jgi:nucleotide-binding universal stress UspA family protein